MQETKREERPPVILLWLTGDRIKRMGHTRDVKIPQAEWEHTVLIQEHIGKADNLVPLDSWRREEEIGQPTAASKWATA